MTPLLDNIIRTCIISSYAMAKVQFDNAKDTEHMMVAARDVSDTLVKAVEHRVQMAAL